MQQGPAPWPIDSAAQTGPGTYYVSGQCPGLEPCETATAAQQFVDPNASARPLTAEYTIYSNLAHAEVCVDLKTVGFTTGQPFVIELPSGRRQVVVKYAGFANVTEDIEAGPGEERTITADFR
jgi:hypothetical protein